MWGTQRRAGEGGHKRAGDFLKIALEDFIRIFVGWVGQ